MNISATVTINRPAQDVYDFVMDVPHDAQWRTGVVEASFTSDGPVGVGTTGFDRIEANGREMVSEWTISELEPGRLARWTLDGGPIKGSGGYVCEQAGDQTAFTLEAFVKPVGSYRLLGPVFGMIGQRQNRADVLKLKEILEQPHFTGGK
ncbi:MAG: SRPBCC family protein [Acidimicrobiia bacterium]